MECACVSTGASDYSSSMISQKTVTARKPHKCGECYRVIPVGQQYEIYAGKSEGDFFTAKTCVDCISLRDAFFCDGYLFEGLWEDMSEHVRECGGDVSQVAISKLTPYALGRVCDDIEELWGDDEDD